MEAQAEGVRVFWYDELRYHADFVPDDTVRMTKCLLTLAALGLWLSYCTAADLPEEPFEDPPHPPALEEPAERPVPELAAVEEERPVPELAASAAPSSSSSESTSEAEAERRRKRELDRRRREEEASRAEARRCAAEEARRREEAIEQEVETRVASRLVAAHQAGEALPDVLRILLELQAQTQRMDDNHRELMGRRPIHQLSPRPWSSSESPALHGRESPTPRLPLPDQEAHLGELFEDGDEIPNTPEEGDGLEGEAAPAKKKKKKKDKKRRLLAESSDRHKDRDGGDGHGGPGPAPMSVS